MEDPVLTSVPIEQIDPSPRNPRSKVGHLEELADSILTYGLLQPVVLRARKKRRFEIVAGHRRVAAARELGWTEIPAILRRVDDDQAFLLSVIENLQRSDLSAREEAAALEVLVRERGWSTRQVAEAVKRSAAYVSRRLRVFDDPTLAPLVLQRRLSVSVAEELLPLPVARRRHLAEQAAEEGWDRRQVRAALEGSAWAAATTRQPSVLRHTRKFRSLVRSVAPGTLTDAERRELRLLFHDLATLAKAPKASDAVVVPPLVVPRAARG
jgi:ParB family chromosome partitioning protein